MKKDPLLIQNRAMLGVLILQYFFGMAVNLFIQFPDTKNETSLWEFAKNQWSVVTHIVLGFLLLIGGIVYLVRTIRRGEKHLIIAASLGLFSILVAVIAGAQFVPTQQDIYSFIMASAFILAVFSYGWGIYKLK